jgi:hypothetical protein
LSGTQSSGHLSSYIQQEEGPLGPFQSPMRTRKSFDVHNVESPAKSPSRSSFDLVEQGHSTAHSPLPSHCAFSVTRQTSALHPTHSRSGPLQLTSVAGGEVGRVAATLQCQQQLQLQQQQQQHCRQHVAWLEPPATLQTVHTLHHPTPRFTRSHSTPLVNDPAAAAAASAGASDSEGEKQ